MLVPSFVNLGMTLDSIDSVFLQVLLLETRLSISFQDVGGLNICILIWCCWCCRFFLFLVSVNRVLIFVGDERCVFKGDSSLQCRIRVCARVVCLFVVGRVIRLICSVFFEGSCFPWRWSFCSFVVFLICFIVWQSVAWVVVMLYESPRR